MKIEKEIKGNGAVTAFEEIEKKLIRENVKNMDALAMICEALQCNLEDIVEYKLEKNGDE